MKTDIETLFEEAKSINEFEFILTLLNYRRMGTHMLLNNLYEWFEAIEFYKRLYSELNGKEKARIAVLLYSTFFENSDFYNIIGSLCKIKLGYRGSPYLLWRTRKYERLLGVMEKRGVLLELLYEADKPLIIEFFIHNHFNEIRNTFFHSAYALSDEEFITIESEPINIDEHKIYSFNVSEFLYPKVEKVILFFDTFKFLYLSSFASYTTDKVVKGYFPALCDVTILGAADGLKGFKIKNSVQFYGEWHDSGIWYDEHFNMYAAHNIRIDMPTVETIEIGDQLKRYEKKDDIHHSDVEFHDLIDEIAERRKPEEISRATRLLLKFGGLRHQRMKEESNPFKKKSYPSYILPFYKKAIEIGSQLFNTTPIKKAIEELEQVQKSY